MSWSYKNGSFWVSESGVFIFYIEKNPCGCCPDSYLVERNKPEFKRATNTLTVYGNINDYIKSYKLRELK